MKRIILFIIISMNLSAFEIKDNIGIFDENSKREFEEKVRKIENKSKKSFIGEYWNYYNNMMKIVFYQGVGRLIRSITDYGIIVCLFSYENFSKKFNVDMDKHLGITDISVMSANSLSVLELLIESSLQITKQNSNKFRK